MTDKKMILVSGKDTIRYQFISSKTVENELLEIKKIIKTNKSASFLQLKKLQELGFRFQDIDSILPTNFLSNYFGVD